MTESANRRVNLVRAMALLCETQGSLWRMIESLVALPESREEDVAVICAIREALPLIQTAANQLKPWNSEGATITNPELFRQNVTDALTLLRKCKTIQGAYARAQLTEAVDRCFALRGSLS